MDENFSDEQLVANYLNGDEHALEVLFRKHLKPIYNFVYRFVNNAQESEDITQEAFVRAWRNLKTFDRQRSFKTWIFSIAKHAALDVLKKKKTIPFSEFETEDSSNAISDTLADSAPLPDALLEKADIARMVASAVEKIALSYRTVLFLRYNDHFTFKEIAESLGEPLNTVKSRHRRALVMLKKLLIES
ncbi:sigma-70 family RNA polymerase sigma factor [Patescibacteria group bacterium]|nr:sigma-70 family RNA polymerase sigma factor [Patescibacteria group bacterium]